MCSYLHLLFLWVSFGKGQMAAKYQCLGWFKSWFILPRLWSCLLNHIRNQYQYQYLKYRHHSRPEMSKSSPAGAAFMRQIIFFVHLSDFIWFTHSTLDPSSLVISLIPPVALVFNMLNKVCQLHLSSQSLPLNHHWVSLMHKAWSFIVVIIFSHQSSVFNNVLRLKQHFLLDLICLWSVH